MDSKARSKLRPPPRRRPRVYRNQLVTRLLGTFFGCAFVAMGAYALLGGDVLTEIERERASSFGWVALIGGVWAIGASWFDSDLRGVWCAPPRRGWWR